MSTVKATAANHLTAEVRLIERCIRSPRRNIPVGDEWLHEVKFDGYHFSPTEIKMPPRFSG
jgi:hypothetical protein